MTTIARSDYPIYNQIGQETGLTREDIFGPGWYLYVWDEPQKWISHANAYLPLEGEARRKSAEDVVAHRRRFAGTPTFDQLNSQRFWQEFYADWTRVRMLRQAKVLGVDVSTRWDRLTIMHCLVDYWMNRMSSV